MAAMAGHLFVLRGDLTKLHCSAVLIPCDTEWRVVVEHWGDFLPGDCLGEANDFGWAPFRKGGGGRFIDVVSTGDKWIRLVVTAGGGKSFNSAEQRAGWVSDGVVEAVAELSRRSLSKPAGRVKPLIGLPLVGTGAGGFERTRGVLIHALLPALKEAARDHDVDIALVLIDDRDHAAVQAVRGPDYWSEVANQQSLSTSHLGIADDLGDAAARGELSLFLGSGVSIPLGLPDWKTLLARVGDRRAEAIQSTDPRDVAQEIEKELGRDEFRRRIADNVYVDGVAPTHLLLAALSVNQNVTTNYDVAYELALGRTRGEIRVLTEQLALQPHPWLLKYHGGIRHPDNIVITRDDYRKLSQEHGALQSIVESLMLTSHLMFVGFSMVDADFLDAAERVKAVRLLAQKEEPSHVATVLALHPQAVMEHTGFRTVSMLEDPSDESAARLLEIFLDRISWRANITGLASSSYLLHPDYQDLFAKDIPTAKLREFLSELVASLETEGHIWQAKGWDQVRQLLRSLGARGEKLG